MVILFWILVITWMLNRAVVDGLYAWRGKPNPRYELRKAQLQATAAANGGGQPAVVAQPRYGTRDWWGDLYSDALAANTRWRRGRATAKTGGGRVDELVDAVREEPRRPVRDRDARSVVHTDEHPYCVTSCGPTCPAGRGTFGWRCGQCGTDRAGFASEDAARADSAAHPCRPADSGAEEADRPTAPVIPLFPNLQEVAMSNGTDVNGLAASIAFAEAAAKAHESFAAAGSEGYTGALAQYEVGDGAIASAREAQEASQIAAAKWAAHLADLTKQTVVKEAYQSVPDAGNKSYLLNG